MEKLHEKSHSDHLGPYFWSDCAIDFGVTDPYHTPELPIGILVLLFFLTGVVIAYLFSLSARFKARRTIKKLNTTMMK